MGFVLDFEIGGIFTEEVGVPLIAHKVRAVGVAAAEGVASSRGQVARAGGEVGVGGVGDGFGLFVYVGICDFLGVAVGLGSQDLGG